jgi:hypothetical protein
MALGGAERIPDHLLLGSVRLQIKGRIVKFGVEIVQTKRMALPDNKQADKQNAETDDILDRFQKE